MADFRCGFVGVVGPTNSGKSTLVNAMIGEKVAIVSPLPQTTYHGVRGILNQPSVQMIFTDTPGFQEYPQPVPRMLNRVADRNAGESDLLLWVFDVSHGKALDQIQKFRKKISQLKPTASSFCALNKVDKIDKQTLLPLIQAIHALGLFAAIIPISAKKSDGIKPLAELLKDHLPVGPAMYPTDAFTDRSRDFLISEFVREKIYRMTKEEIPYSVWVETEGEETGGKVPTIRVVLHVDSNSRKGILIGKGGSLLKKIGTEARSEIEKMMGAHICLKLHVDVHDEWKNDANHLNRYLELA
jgi:GTPase